MLRKILIGVAVVVAVFMIVVATRPPTFHIERSTVISAPPDTVFAQVNDFHEWLAWSPWEKLDPDLKRIYEGSPAGVGSIYSWEGNSKVGEGRMTITESRPNELVRFKLDFIKPMQGTSDAEFAFKPEGNQTVVSWTMSGKQNFAGKAISLFMDCDKMIGGQFEQGLASIKSIVETGGK